ncbi:hypothetical protein N181_03390 [Sinorhizobium fredii USDA 205]|nr:hypothetical protein N181_03390 [Sinorhizobium fredii USDA 205]
MSECLPPPFLIPLSLTAGRGDRGHCTLDDLLRVGH